MNQSRFSKLSYVLLLFMLVACQAQATSMPTVATAIPPIGKITGTIPLKIAPLYPVIVGFGSLWLLNDSKGTITRLDLASHEIIATIKVGDTRNDIAPNGNPGSAVVVGDSLWVTSTAEHQLARIDPKTNQVVERISLGQFKVFINQHDFLPYALASDGDSLWVSDVYLNLIRRVDLMTKQVVATIPEAHAVQVTVSGGGSIWGIEGLMGNVLRIDPATNKIVARIPLGGKLIDGECGLCSMSLAFGEGSVWTADNLGKTVSRIDPATNKVVAKIDLGQQVIDVKVWQGAVWAIAAPAPIWSVAPAKCDATNSSIVRIDPTTNQMVGKLAAACAWGLVPDTDALWVMTGTQDNPTGYSIIRFEP